MRFFPVLSYGLSCCVYEYDYLREFVWETHVILAQAREEGGPKRPTAGGGVGRNSRRSNATFFDILCVPPSAARVRCVFSQKGHSGCSPVRSEKPGPPPGGLSGPIFRFFFESGPMVWLPGTSWARFWRLLGWILAPWRCVSPHLIHTYIFHKLPIAPCGPDTRVSSEKPSGLGLSGALLGSLGLSWEVPKFEQLTD